MIEVGIDGGVWFLKVCINILKSKNEQTKNNFYYPKNAFFLALYDSCVKKLFTLAVAEF